MEKEATLKAGDLCLDCQQLGLEKYLKLFKINLNGDTLLKCESNMCMFPYNDEMSSSDEEEEEEQRNDKLAEATFIEDFIQYCNNEDDIKTTNNDLQLTNEQLTNEQLTQFDITFFGDDLNENDNKNLCKSEVIIEKGEHLKNESNDYIAVNNHSSLPTINSLPSEIPITKEIINESSSASTNDSNTDCKRKIDIQSIETIKFETPLYDIKPTTSSQTFTTITDIASKNSSSPEKPLQFSSNKSKSRLKSATEPNSFVIPKADIMKGNALLKKLADVNEKSAEVTKYKGARSRKCIKVEEIKKQEQPNPSSSRSNGLNYSVEQISEMLTTKMKKDS